MKVQHRLTGEQMEVVDPSYYYTTLGGSLLPRNDWVPVSAIMPDFLSEWRLAEWQRINEGMPD